MNIRVAYRAVCALPACGAAATAWSHGVAGGDAAYLKSMSGVQFLPRMYLGAKHIVAGYDRLLFLAGVLFFLYRLKDMALYATLFAFGHSKEGLAGNILAFNLGVELGQIISLTFILLAFQLWRRSGLLARGANAANMLIMNAGFVLVGYQLTGLFMA